MRTPSVLVPYPGPTSRADEQDIALYLRPESNGVRVESTILRAIRQSPQYANRLALVYLANLPGSFIVSNNIVVEHYTTKVHFARHGKNAFTQGMQRRFEELFGAEFASAQIIGAYEAMERFGLGPEELFRVWVGSEDFGVVLGQTIKRYRGTYVVNYDVPRLLELHDDRTDVFSMLLRTDISYAEFQGLVDQVEQALHEQSIITGNEPVSHVFHYSKGPFEQILDAIGYLWTPQANHVPLDQISFLRFLLDRGCEHNRVLHMVGHPLVLLEGTGETRGRTEVNLFEYTRQASYQQALEKYRSIAEPLDIGP